MTTNEKLYLDAYNAYVPSPDDNPDCIPYYRHWKGVNAVVGDEMDKMYHTIIHNASCWGKGTWQDAVKGIRSMKKTEYPKPPVYRYNYNCAPDTDDTAVLKSAEEHIIREFKRVYPDKRINSKFFKEKRDSVLSQAIECAKKRISAEYREWEIKDMAIDAETADMDAKYAREVASIDAMNNWIDSLQD